MSKYVVTSSWSDAPHLSEDAKKGLISAYLPHEQKARTEGIPALGSGAIYPIPEEEFLVDPFEFPAWYRHAYALDVGWNRTAALWGALNPEDQTLYLYSEYYRAQAEPPIHAEAIRGRGTWIPGCIDPASRGRNQKDGEALMATYLGLQLMIVPADNAVESGIYAVWTRLSTGKMKVFKTLQNWRNEYRIYRRDERGKVVKDNDHLMDDTRYLCMTGVNIAAQKPPHLWGQVIPTAKKTAHQVEYNPLQSAWAPQQYSATGQPQQRAPWMPHGPYQR